VEPGWLWVETIRRSTCGSCSAAKGCGHGILNTIGDGHRNFLKVSSAAFPEGRFRVDDQVSIAVPEQMILRGSFVVYMVPLLCTLVLGGAFAALIPAASDLDAVLGAGVGFLAGIGLVRWHAVASRDDARMQPRLLGPAGNRFG
jgi:sigma-E factor negative regulatory protein RseC